MSDIFSGIPVPLSVTFISIFFSTFLVLTDTVGSYPASLTIQTLKGCINQTSGYISIKDSLPDDGDRIKIFSLFPNPVPDRFKAVLWSKTGDVKCELSVTDIYGVRKWSRSIILYKGYNIFDIPAATLITGPYYLKASTTYGVKSKVFFKL